MNIIYSSYKHIYIYIYTSTICLFQKLLNYHMQIYSRSIHFIPKIIIFLNFILIYYN